MEGADGDGDGDGDGDEDEELATYFSQRHHVLLDNATQLNNVDSSSTDCIATTSFAPISCERMNLEHLSDCDDRNETNMSLPKERCRCGQD